MSTKGTAKVGYSRVLPAIYVHVLYSGVRNQALQHRKYLISRETKSHSAVENRLLDHIPLEILSHRSIRRDRDEGFRARCVTLQSQDCVLHGCANRQAFY